MKNNGYREEIKVNLDSNKQTVEFQGYDGST